MPVADDRIADIFGNVGIRRYSLLYYHSDSVRTFMYESGNVFPGAYPITVESRIV